MILASLLAMPSIAWSQDSPDDEIAPRPGETFERGNDQPLPDDPWWNQLGDQALPQFIELGLSRSHDVAAALSRVDGAEARAERVEAGFYPSLSLDSSLSGQPSESLGFQFQSMIPTMPGGTGGAEETDPTSLIYNGSAMLNFRYSPDLFGMNRRSWRAARAALAASGGDADAVASALSIQVAEAYFDEVAARQQIAVIQRQIELNQSLLDLLEVRYDQNAATAVDVLQQRQQLASTRARLPGATALARMARERLALLLGMRLDEAERELPRPSETLPVLPAGAATGRPLDLVEHRPELRAARSRVQAAQESLRAAWLQAFPTLSLSANAGGQLFARDDVRTTETWGFGATVSIPIFRGLVERAAVREARAELRAARHTFEGTLLQAIAEVEGAIATEQEQREQLEANRELLEAAQLAFQVSRDSYIEGVGSYLVVMTSLATLQVAELTIIQNQRSVISARLALYQALGGDWSRGLAPRGRGDE